MWTVWSKEMHAKQAAMRDGGAGTVRKRGQRSHDPGRTGIAR